MPKRKTTSEFIKEAKAIHSDKYDYSEVVYKNSGSRVLIKCKIHGVFEKSPEAHLRGHGCNDCSKRIKPTIENFISRANKIHNGKYEYIKTSIKTNKDKVNIICPEHGVFPQAVVNHLQGQGCPKCGQLSRATSQRISKSEWVKKMKKTHGSKYDYSKAKFVNNTTEVEIICPDHGSFAMKPNNHQQGQGCKECGILKRNQNLVLEYRKFIKRATKVHGHKYIYDEKSYDNYTTKMRIFCSEHGWFEQTPHSHISMKAGCKECGYVKMSLANKMKWEDVLDLFYQTHGDKYDYSQANYIDVSKKIKIICPEHGSFPQKPYSHYQGSKCKYCSIEENADKLKIDFDEFISRARERHGDLYEYSFVNYKDIFTPVTINCNKHGLFEQNPRDHYRGSGCPKCLSSKGEKKIRSILKGKRIKFKEQKRFKELEHKMPLRCDFFLPDHNTVIEYNGIQHYEPIEVFGGIKGLENNQLRDTIKYDYLESKSINLIIVKYDVKDLESYLLDSLNSI